MPGDDHSPLLAGQDLFMLGAEGKLESVPACGVVARAADEILRPNPFDHDGVQPDLRDAEMEHGVPRRRREVIRGPGSLGGARLTDEGRYLALDRAFRRSRLGGRIGIGREEDPAQNATAQKEGGC
jgi:hypothetical protein